MDVFLLWVFDGDYALMEIFESEEDADKEKKTAGRDKRMAISSCRKTRGNT
jgi:hypothetical protein